MSQPATSGEKPKKTKATAAQTARRIEELLRIRLDGAEWWDIREYVSEKEKEPGSVWELPPDAKPLSDAQLRRYVNKADKLIAESCRSSRKKLFRRHLAQRRNLFAKAVSQGDIRTALAVSRDEAELLGLYPPKKIAPTNPKGDKPYGELTDEERWNALQTLLARMGAGTGDALVDGSDEPGRPLLDGPVPGDDRGGDEARPLAGGVIDEALEPGITPLFTSGG